MHARSALAPCVPGSRISIIRQSIITIVVALLILFRPAVGLAWEVGDFTEVFVTEDHFQEVKTSTDGAGGMLAVTIKQNPVPDRIYVSRLSHTGTEVWGDNGYVLPVEINDLWNSFPVDTTYDGGGGGYFAYRAGRTGFDMLRLVLVAADGNFEWMTTLDNLGPLGAGDVPRVQLTPTQNGEVIVTWIKFLPTLELYCARVDHEGSILWHGQVVTSTWTAGNGWTAAPDGEGGAFVSFTTPGGDARVQRISAGNGTRLWGPDGALVWSLNGAVEDVVAAGGGGAFVVRSLGGIAYAQHLDAAGTKTWASDVLVHDSQTPYFALSTTPRVCADGGGGFLLVHGHERVFAQRVGAAGNLIWPSATTIADSTDVGPPARIEADGFGGAFVVYEDHWNVTPGGNPCDRIHVARVDAFGNEQWDDITAFCGFSWGAGGVPVFDTQPEAGVPIADGSGGVMVAYEETDAGSGNSQRVLAQGYDPSGNPPSPRLDFLFPDAAEPDQTGPYTVLGDYIDLDMGYTLVKESGTVQLGLAPTEQIDARSVGGEATLTGLTPGSYHLVVDLEGTPADTLMHAVGIGSPMPCDADGPVLGEARDVALSGSKRASTFAPDGLLHAVWIEFEPEASEYQLRLQTFDGAWIRHEPLLVDLRPMSSPSIASDANGRLHLAVLREVGPSDDELIVMHVAPDGRVEVSDVFQDGRELGRPVVAVTPDERTHVLVQAGTGVTQELIHLEFDGGFSGPQVVAAGFVPREPDVAVQGDELEVVFARNSFVPGVQQVERAHYAGGTWDTPELLSFALSVSSPAVAFDGDERLLYAVVLDNEAVNGIPPLVHTRIREAGVLGPLKARPGLSRHHDVQLAALGSRRFALMTMESEGGPIVSIFVRESDGHVVFPRHQANVGTDVSDPHLTAHWGGRLVFTHWRDYQDPDAPVVGQICEARVATSAEPSVPQLLRPALTASPNPFNPSTTFEFSLARDASVRLDVFDLRGRRVRQVYVGPLSAGPHAIRWNGQDDGGDPVASGVYLARLDRGDGSATLRKVALVE